MGKTLERQSKYTAHKRSEHFTVCNFYKTFKKRRKAYTIPVHMELAFQTKVILFLNG